MVKGLVSRNDWSDMPATYWNYMYFFEIGVIQRA
jgi:hypothetical protein